MHWPPKRTPFACAALLAWGATLHFLSTSTFGQGIRLFCLLVLLALLVPALRWAGRRVRGELPTRATLIVTGALCCWLAIELGHALCEELRAPTSQSFIFDIGANTVAAGGFFLDGQNPYANPAQLGAAIEPGTPHVSFAGDRIEMFGIPYAYGYPYFPAMFLSYLPFRALVSGFNSIRAGNAAFLFAGAFLLFALARRLSVQSGARDAGAGAAGLLAVTAYLGVTGWRRELFAFGVTDIAIATAAIGGYLALACRRDLLAGVLLGWAQAAKLLPGPLLVVPLIVHLRGRRPLARLLTGYLVTTGAVVLPFLLWDPARFVSGTILFYLTHHAGGDDTSLWYFLPAILKAPFRLVGLALAAAISLRGRGAEVWDLSRPIACAFASYLVFVATNVMSHLNYVWAVYTIGCLAFAAAVTGAGAAPAEHAPEPPRASSPSRAQ